MTDAKKPVDWPAIELEYRAGLKPIRLIAEQYGISHVTLIQRAKREEWIRDLNAKIKAKEDVIVTKALSAKRPTAPATKRTPTKVEKKTTLVAEKRFVENAAGTKAAVRIEQANRFERQFRLIDVQMSELEQLSSPEGVGMYERLLDATREPDAHETAEEMRARKKKQSDLLAKAFDIHERIDSTKKVIDMTEKVTKMQREAYGITDKTIEAEESAGKVLTDAERASRLATIFAGLRARQADAQLAEPPTVTTVPDAS